MVSRRAWLRSAVGAGAALGLSPRMLEALEALQSAPLVQRAIPSTGELLPIIGLGSADTYAETALRESREETYETIAAVLRTLVDGGGAVFDTAYGYGASEQVSGQVAEEEGLADRIWWSTKMNAAPMTGFVSEAADPDEARYQIQRSFLRLRRRQIDLFQIHNVGDPATQLPFLKQLKEERFIRYIGVTSTAEEQYPALVDVMRNEPIDFIGINYAIDDRAAEEVVLPLALERGIAVLGYLPFGRGRLWDRIGERPLPEWANDFDAYSWAQLMLKFVAADPAVTCVCPGTSNPAHMADNLGAGRGSLPDGDQLERLIRYVDGLPGG